MKNIILTSSVCALLLTAGGCTRNIPIGNGPRTIDHAPVAQVQTRAPVANRQVPARTAAPVPFKQATQAPAEKQMSQAVREDLNRKLAGLEDALFDYDKSIIRSDASTALKDDVGVIRDILANYPRQKLLIEGHADERGSEEYNLALGDRRARAVEDFLSSMGIPNNQLTVISYGKERPVCADETESCWQRNRRAHVTAATP